MSVKSYVAVPARTASVDLMVGIKDEVTDGYRGFSLTELVFLLAMVGIVAASSIPILSSSMREWQLAADARNIATGLTYAKITATSQMTHCQLTFDMTGNTWSSMKYNRSTSTYVLQGSTNQLSSGMANSGIAFKSSSSSAPTGYPTTSSTAITFNSRGIAVDGGGNPTICSIYLSDAGTDYAVTVSLAGKVQVWKHQTGGWTVQ